PKPRPGELLVRIRASSLNFHDDMVVPEAPGSHLKRLLRKWHGPFQARLTPSVIPSEVEESLILTITSSKRCLDCARHDKKPIWATLPKFFDTSTPFLAQRRNPFLKN